MKKLCSHERDHNHRHIYHRDQIVLATYVYAGVPGAPTGCNDIAFC
ncbi:MAG TPA: hypothetical protein ACHBZA_03535 [Arsenophonus apicola]